MQELVDRLFETEQLLDTTQVELSRLHCANDELNIEISSYNLHANALRQSLDDLFIQHQILQQELRDTQRKRKFEVEQARSSSVHLAILSECEKMTYQLEIERLQAEVENLQADRSSKSHPHGLPQGVKRQRIATLAEKIKSQLAQLR